MVLILDRLRNPENDSKRLEDYKSIQAGFPAFSVAETGENGCLHYQGLVDIDISAPSYSQKFKRKGYKGNESFSNKQVNPDEKDRTLQYLCKGPKEGTHPTVVVNTMNLSYEQIAAYHLAYWKENSKIKHPKKDKQKTFRETFHEDFIEYLNSQTDLEMGKYKLSWIGVKLFEFTGMQPRSEMTNWLKGVVFWAQAVLLQHDVSAGRQKAVEIWVDRILS